MYLSEDSRGSSVKCVCVFVFLFLVMEEVRIGPGLLLSLKKSIELTGFVFRYKFEEQHHNMS